ncbi:MAG: amidohydrolase family protein [Myxococcales bacterium]|nr:amidohydrolase family protein [Myxococcales bacterium]
MTSRKSRRRADVELPFAIGPSSNGEFIPAAPAPRHRAATELALQRAADVARRTGVDRRRFMHGLGAIAVTLGAINELAACSDAAPSAGADLDAGARDVGGEFVVPDAHDAAATCAALAGDEFIFDVQTHHVEPGGAWVSAEADIARTLRIIGPDCGPADKLECLTRYHYLRDIYLRSDTSMSVLSAVPSTSPDVNPLTFSMSRETINLLDQLAAGGAPRALLHTAVVPNGGNLQAALDLMQKHSESNAIAAWKVYTPYVPQGGAAYFLDDAAVGVPMIEKARSLGIKTICAHKGLPLFGFSAQHASPRDVGVVAARFPDVRFVIYHSGWDPAVSEGPYDASNARGIDALIKSLADNNIAPNSNVYAELGTTWRNLMSEPTQAAHALGKLLVHVGEDRVLWGTDSIWSGSPQPQIVAFRAFEITPAFQQLYGYPALSKALKAKVLGLNAAALYNVDVAARRCALDADEVEKLRLAFGGDLQLRDDTPYPTRGPTTRRALLRFLARHGQRKWTPS